MQTMETKGFFIGSHHKSLSQSVTGLPIPYITWLLMGTVKTGDCLSADLTL